MLPFVETHRSIIMKRLVTNSFLFTFAFFLIACSKTFHCRESENLGVATLSITTVGLMPYSEGDTIGFTSESGLKSYYLIKINDKNYVEEKQYKELFFSNELCVSSTWLEEHQVVELAEISGCLVILLDFKSIFNPSLGEGNIDVLKPLIKDGVRTNAGITEFAIDMRDVEFEQLYRSQLFYDTIPSLQVNGRDYENVFSSDIFRSGFRPMCYSHSNGLISFYDLDGTKWTLIP